MIFDPLVRGLDSPFRWLNSTRKPRYIVMLHSRAITLEEYNKYDWV